MKKITEIYIQKEYMKSERDAFGNRVKIPTVGSFKRDPVMVTQGARFGHFLIDLIIIGIITHFLNVFLGIIAPQAVNYTSGTFSISIGSKSIDSNLSSYLVLILYYFITEMTMQRSIGKFATNTVVIDE